MRAIYAMKLTSVLLSTQQMHHHATKLPSPVLMLWLIDLELLVAIDVAIGVWRGILLRCGGLVHFLHSRSGGDFELTVGSADCEGVVVRHCDK